MPFLPDHSCLTNPFNDQKCNRIYNLHTHLKYFTLIFLILLSSRGSSFAGVKNTGESKTNNSKSYSFIVIKPELLIGKTLPGHSNFPQTNLQSIFSLSIGQQINDSNKAWAVFFNYPEIGLTLAKTNFGNALVLGNAYTLMPYISINLTPRLKHSFNIKTGLGASYFTKHFNKYENPANKSIGSSFTWSFQLMIDHSLFLTRYFSINLGVGYFHHSNGHTQLPNLGLNSVLVSLSAKFYPDPLRDEYFSDYDKPVLEKTKQLFTSARSGIGFHELGGPNSDIERIKKTIYSTSIGGGVIFKRVIKVRIGLTYNYYSHYYNFITKYQLRSYVEKPFVNSSNVYVYAGCEFLIGYVGLDTEIGVNLYKPFYAEQSRLFENDNQFKYWLKKTFVTRLRLKLYALNTSNNPKNNLFLGVHINANFLQADFSGLSVGYVHRFKSKQ